MTTTDCREAFEKFCEENKFKPMFNMWCAFNAAWNAAPTAAQTGGQGEAVSPWGFAVRGIQLKDEKWFFVPPEDSAAAKYYSESEWNGKRTHEVVTLWDRSPSAHQQCVEAMKGAMERLSATGEECEFNDQAAMAFPLDEWNDFEAQLTAALRGMGVEP